MLETGPSSFKGTVTWDRERSSKAAMGVRGVGAQRPALREDEPKKTGARSGRTGCAAQRPDDCKGTVTRNSIVYEVGKGGVGGAQRPVLCDEV